MGSLFSALTTAVSGLDAQASAIGNVSDNLANAQTTGYKAVQTNFEELVNASNATTNNPGGVTAQPEYQNDVQGSITSSNVVTNLAISGEGYFATQTASSTAGGSTLFNSEVFYTRAGDFTLDQNGYLVNGGGYYLDAWPVTNGVANSSIVQPVQVSALLNDPVPTSTISFQGNLPSNASVGYTADPSTVQIYDALGNSHDVTYTWSKTGTNTWDLTVNDADATGGGSPYSTVIPFSFNGSAPGTISSIGGTTAVGGSPYTVEYADLGGQSGGCRYSPRLRGRDRGANRHAEFRRLPDIERPDAVLERRRHRHGHQFRPERIGERLVRQFRHQCQRRRVDRLFEWHQSGDRPDPDRAVFCARPTAARVRRRFYQHSIHRFTALYHRRHQWCWQYLEQFDRAVERRYRHGVHPAYSGAAGLLRERQGGDDRQQSAAGHHQYDSVSRAETSPEGLRA